MNEMRFYFIDIRDICCKTILGLCIFVTFIFQADAGIETVNKGKRFENNLCVQVKFFQGQPLSDLPMLKKLGVKWVRDEDQWHLIEQKAGVYAPLSASLQTRLAYYKANDIGVIFIVGGENPVAYPNSKENPYNFVNAEAYGNYVAYMAKQLKASGVRFVLELWNEPHNRLFAQKEHLGGVWHGGPPSPWVDQYVKMVGEAVRRVKAIDPSIRLITDDDMWIVHYFFLDKGLPKDLDGFAVHPYTGGRPPEITAVEYQSDWTKPYHVVDQDQSFASAVRRLVEHGQLKMGKKPSIWATEWGWRVGEKSPDGLVVSEAEIAAYLPRAFILATASGVEATCWFSAQDAVDGPMGLKTNDGRLRPAFDAFVELYQTLGKTHYECELKQETTDTDKRAFLFRKDNDWLIASWHTKKAYPDNQVQYLVRNSHNYRPNCI
jgi:hypothetical protein